MQNSALLVCCFLFSSTYWHHPQAGTKMAATLRPLQPDQDLEKQPNPSWVTFPSSFPSSLIGWYRLPLNQSLARTMGSPGRLVPIRTCPLGLGRQEVEGCMQDSGWKPGPLVLAATLFYSLLFESVLSEFLYLFLNNAKGIKIRETEREREEIQRLENPE